MKSKPNKFLTLLLISLNLKIAYAGSSIATVSGLYPTEIKTIYLNNSLEKLQANQEVEVPPTLPNERIYFHVSTPGGGLLLVQGSLDRITTLEDGKLAFVVSMQSSNSEAAPEEKIIPVERIVPNSISVDPVFSKAQVQESAFRILEAHQKGEQITFKEVHSGKIVDSSEVGRIEGVVIGDDGIVERFYIATSFGSLMTKSPGGIVPGSIKELEISPRKLSKVENDLLMNLQAARQNRQLVFVKMKPEHQSYSWGPGRANSSTGFIESINLVGDGEWVISIKTNSPIEIVYRLDEIEPKSFQVVSSGLRVDGHSFGNCGRLLQ